MSWSKRAAISHRSCDDLTQDGSFAKSTVTGLVVWQRPDVTVARVGPKTLAVGSLGEVDNSSRCVSGQSPT